jgi:cytosine/adenosine deaminase-related metal-dependent hydrolase
MLAEAAGELGVRIGIAFETTDRNGSDVREDALDENEWALRTCSDDPFLHPMIGLHASFTLEDETLGRVADLLGRYPDTGIHIHLSEGVEDGEDAVQRGFDSPLKRLDKFGLLGNNSLLIHGVHCGEEDHALMHERGVMLVHNPSSNANNRVGFPSASMLEDVSVGLGTDGMQMDMLAEAKEGTLAWSACSEIGASTPDLVRMLLKNNPAIATRMFGTRIGHVAAGYVADLSVYTYDPRTPLTPENINGHLLFGGFCRPRHVLTDGRFSVRDGQLVRVDEEALRAESRSQAQRLWEAMNEV